VIPSTYLLPPPQPHLTTRIPAGTSTRDFRPPSARRQSVVYVPLCNLIGNLQKNNSASARNAGGGALRTLRGGNKICRWRGVGGCIDFNGGDLFSVTRSKVLVKKSPLAML